MSSGYLSFRSLLHVQGCNSWTSIMIQGTRTGVPEPAELEPCSHWEGKADRWQSGKGWKHPSTNPPWTLRGITDCWDASRLSVLAAYPWGLHQWHCQVGPWEYQGSLLMSGHEGEASPVSLNRFLFFLPHTPWVSRENWYPQHSHLNLEKILFQFLIDS